MIEPFEYEPKHLVATKPAGIVASSSLGSFASIDMDVNRSMSRLIDPVETMRLDTQQTRIFQTKIGNPFQENTHESVLVPDRIIGLGALVRSDNPPALASTSTRSTSEILSNILDHQATFIPSNTKHVLPAMNINSLDSPYLSPGLTSIDSHKVKPNWA